MVKPKMRVLSRRIELVADPTLDEIVLFSPAGECLLHLEHLQRHRGEDRWYLCIGEDHIVKFGVKQGKMTYCFGYEGFEEKQHE